MGDSRRTFLKKSLAGAVLLGASGSIAQAGMAYPVKPKPAIAVNTFHL